MNLSQDTNPTPPIYRLTWIGWGEHRHEDFEDKGLAYDELRALRRGDLPCWIDAV